MTYGFMQLIEISVEYHLDTEFEGTRHDGRSAGLQWSRRGENSGDHIVSLQHIKIVKVASTMNNHIQNSNRSSEINLVQFENHATNRFVSPRHFVELLNAAGAARFHGASF